MPENSNRNMFAFMVLAIAILIGYEFLVIQPQHRREQAAAAAEAKLKQAQVASPGAAAPAAPLTRDQALAASPRVAFDSPTVTGSIALRGARIDDLRLKRYRQTLDKPDMVELLRPDGVQYGQFAEFAWLGANVPGLPNKDTVWTLASGATLTPTTPVVLTYDNGAGLQFTRTISLDQQYLFTVSDTVVNRSGQPVQIAPFASVQRQGAPADVGHNSIVYEGGIGVLGDGEGFKLMIPGDLKYPKWRKERTTSENASHGGWLGLTDKYWMTALIPDQKANINTQFRFTPVMGGEVFEANYRGQPRTIAPGFQTTETTRLFAGAKTVPVLDSYEKSIGAPRFEDAIDWGRFWFFTKPFFSFLEFIYKHVGNFGLAILALTVAVKLVFFPLANKSFESMTKMKKVQPVMEELKKKYPNDPAAMQKEVMALYQREKINPLTGCLPMFIQIPVFYSLYKVLTVTIEMRHAPFFGWVHDLSARDPSTFVNLFGLIPWDPAMTPMIGAFLNGPLHVGAWAIAYGFTTWLSQSMNPAATDPVQQRMFQLMPLIFTFMLAQLAVGLLIYYSWNNLLTILQQYVIMRRLKVDNPIDRVLHRLTGKPSGGVG